MRITELVTILIRGFRVVLSAVAVGLILAAIVVAVQPREYTSSTTLYIDIDTPDFTSSTDLIEAQAFARERAITLKELATTDFILKPVAEQNGVTPAELRPHVTALSVLNSTVVQIIVTWDDSQGAADIANEIADVAIDRFTEPTTGAVTTQITQVRPAEPSSTPTSPNVPFTLGLGFLAGLLIGCAFVLIRKAMTARIDSATELDALGLAPIIGSVRARAGSEERVGRIADIAVVLTSAAPFRDSSVVTLASATAKASSTWLVDGIAEYSAGAGAPLTVIRSGDPEAVPGAATDGHGRILIEETGSLSDRVPPRRTPAGTPVAVVVPLGSTTRGQVVTAAQHLAAMGLVLGGFILVGVRRGQDALSTATGSDDGL